MEICAGLNFYNNGSGCNVAVYDTDAARPANCRVGMANVTTEGLATGDVAVALVEG